MQTQIPTIRLQNDVVQALTNYCDRLLDDKDSALKNGSREEAACMLREYRSIAKLRSQLIHQTEKGNFKC